MFLSSCGNPESSNCSGFHAKNLKINEVSPEAHDGERVEITWTRLGEYTTTLKLTFDSNS